LKEKDETDLMAKPIFNEDTLSEKPAIEQLKKLGYEYIYGDELAPELNEKYKRTSHRCLCGGSL
jgi:hypothetical protein